MHFCHGFTHAQNKNKPIPNTILTAIQYNISCVAKQHIPNHEHLSQSLTLLSVKRVSMTNLKKKIKSFEGQFSNQNRIKNNLRCKKSVLSSACCFINGYVSTLGFF